MTKINKILIGALGALALLAMILGIVALSQKLEIPGATPLSLKEVYSQSTGALALFLKNVKSQIGMAYIGSIIVVVFSAITLVYAGGIFFLEKYISKQILSITIYVFLAIAAIALIISIIGLVDAKHVTDIQWLMEHM